MPVTKIISGMMTVSEIPTLGFAEALKASASRIFIFSGRSRRSEYWWTRLLVFVAGIVLTPLSGFLLNVLMIPLTFRRLHDTGHSGWWWGGCALLQIALVIALVGDVVDVGLDRIYSDSLDWLVILRLWAKYVLFFCAIGIYKVVLLVVLCLDSDRHTNRYGPSPKYVGGDGRLA